MLPSSLHCPPEKISFPANTSIHKCGYSSANDTPFKTSAPIAFHTKCAIIGVHSDFVHYKSTVINRLIVSTFNTGITPASKAPPCNNVKIPV